jgi:flagellar basal body rod protein FlgG
MDFINKIKSKLPTHKPNASMLDPANRSFLLFLTIVAISILAWVVYATTQPSREDVVESISATGSKLSKSNVTIDSKVTDEYAQDIRTVNKQAYEKSKKKLEGSTLPTLYNVASNKEDVIEKCGCSFDDAAKEALIKEILSRGVGRIGNADAMRVGLSDIYIRPSSLLVDDLNKPYLYNKKEISTDESGALVYTESGSPVLSINDAPTHLSNKGVLFDKTTTKLSMAGKLLSSTGVIVLGDGLKASRPRMMTQIGASDTYLTTELQLATMDGKPVMHSGNFVFKSKGDQLHNAYNENIVWNDKPVLQSDEGILSDRSLNKFKQLGILFSYDSILIDNNSMLTKKINDTQRFGTSDIYVNKNNELVDRHLNDITHKDYRVKNGVNNELFTQLGAMRNNLGERVSLQAGGRLKAVKGVVLTGTLKSGLKIPFDKYGHLITRKGKLERLGDSDVYVTSDRFLSSGRGLALQYQGKDTFQDINRFKVIKNIEAYGLKNRDGGIVRDLLRKEVYINSLGQFIYLDGEIISQTGLLAEHGGILMGPDGLLLNRQQVRQLLTDKNGNKVSYKNMDVYTNSEGQLIDENGDYVFDENGQAIFLKDGVLVNSSGEVLENPLLFSGVREISKGEGLIMSAPLLDDDGNPLFINGIEAYVADDGSLVDGDGNKILGDDGIPLFLDENNNVINEQGQLQDVKLENAQGDIVRDIHRGKPVIKTSRGNNILFNGKPVSFKDGFLVDNSGELILDDNGNPVKMNSKGQLVDEHGNIVNVPGLSVNGESFDLTDGLLTKHILLDENGNPVTVKGRKVLLNEDGSLTYLDGTPVTNKNGKQVFKVGDEFTDSVGGLLNFETDNNSPFKGVELITGPDGTALTYKGKKVFKRSDGSLIDQNGNPILDENENPLFMNENNEIISADGELANISDFAFEGKPFTNEGVSAQAILQDDLESSLFGVKALTGANGSPLMLNGKKVYKRADGSLIDEDGNVVLGDDGEPLKMNSNGDIVNADGTKADMAKFTINGKSAEGVIIQSKPLSHIEVPSSLRKVPSEAVLGADGTPLLFNGKPVFKLKDGSLVDQFGNAIIGEDGVPLFLNDDNVITDGEGSVVSTSGFSVNGKKVSGGDLKKIETSDLLSIGDTGVRITSDGLLVDKNGKEITHNGRGIRRGDNGQLFYSDGTEVLDESGLKVYMDSEGKLHDGKGNAISGVTLLNGDNQLVGGSELEAKKIGSSDLFVNKRNNLVDASNKPFIHKGKPILVSGGKLITDDKKSVVDAKGNPISITRSGALIDRSRLPAKGAFITDTKGVVVDNKGRYVNSGGKMTSLSDGGPFVTENGLLVNKEGKAIIINGKHVYIDDQNQMTSFNGRSIRYKGRKLHIDKRGNVLDENDETLTYEGEVVTLTNDGLTGSDGRNLSNQAKKSTTNKAKKSLESFLTKNESTEAKGNESKTPKPISEQLKTAKNLKEVKDSSQPVKLTATQILAVNARYNARKAFLRSKLSGYQGNFVETAKASTITPGGEEFLAETNNVTSPTDNYTDMAKEEQSSEAVSPEYPEKRKAGTMLYAVNTYRVNTDLNSKVVFNLFGVERNSSLYKGTVHGTVELVYDYIVVNFNKICPFEGECFAFEGVGIDPGTSELSIAGEIDKHFWYRFGGLSLAALFQGGAEAVQSSRARTEETDETGKTVSYSGLDTDKLLISSTGVLAETLSGIFTENVSRPYTGIIKKDEEIGIFLLEDMIIPN